MINSSPGSEMRCYVGFPGYAFRPPRAGAGRLGPAGLIARYAPIAAARASLVDTTSTSGA